MSSWTGYIWNGRWQEAKPVRVWRISMAFGERSQFEVVRDVGDAIKHQIADVGLAFGYGVGAWGTEPCVHIETATPNDITPVVVALLQKWGQEAAYVCRDGRDAFEINPRAEWSRITGALS